MSGDPRTPLRPATLVVHSGLPHELDHGSLAPPMVPASTFVHGNARGFEYGRETNPTWELLEELTGALEGAAGSVVFSSGMAAITAVTEQVPTGGRVVAAHAGYSGTRRLLHAMASNGRISVKLVDIADTDAVAEACAGGAELVLLESITNPLITVPDMRRCIELARAAGAVTMVDNTFATPLLVRPLALGADVVVHSLTKYAGGHSDLILGCAVASSPDLVTRLREQRTMCGSIPGQLETWACLRGIRTLDVRFRRQMGNAAELAQRLEAHPDVHRVLYPGLLSHPHRDRAAALFDDGFGAMISIEVDGDAARADAVCNAVRLWAHTTSLGGFESTLERRARYALDAEVCPPNLLRLSVGIEDVDDLWDDLSAALEATRS